MNLLMSRFSFKESPFAGQAPTVTGKRAVIFHDAMAGNEDGERIGGASPRHGPKGFRRSNLGGNLGITRNRTDGNSAQGLPYALLKFRSAQVEREIPFRFRRFHQFDHLGEKAPELDSGADQDGDRETLPQIKLKVTGIVAEQDGANPLAALRHQNETERASTGGKINF
jgi:hypothetical protein